MWLYDAPSCAQTNTYAHVHLKPYVNEPLLQHDGALHGADGSLDPARPVLIDALYTIYSLLANCFKPAPDRAIFPVEAL